MKNHYTLFIAFLISFTMHAQNIDIPDANFKNALISNSVAQLSFSNIWEDVDTNNDDEISITEAEAVTRLNIESNSISSIEGIEFFINLQSLNCQNNQLLSLNVNALTELSSLDCRNNQLTNLNINGLTALLELYCSNNLLATLDVSSLTAITVLDMSQNQLTSLILGNLESLYSLDCGNNQLSTLAVDTLPFLGYLGCYNNQLTNLTFGSSDSLFQIECQSNLLTSIDISGYPYMTELYCFDNQITSLDFSNHLVEIEYLEAFSNQITSLFLKNGFQEFNPQNFEQYSFGINSNTYICVDENEIDSFTSILVNHGYTDFFLNSYCSFIPGGDYYTIEGSAKIDLNNNGCDTNDVNYPHLNFIITNGTETGNFISNTSGDYTFPVQEGLQTITPTIENPDYFSVSPSSFTVDFPVDTSPLTQNFCLTPNGTYNDLEVTIIPLSQLRQGFDCYYTLIYKNKGTTTLSGTVDFTDDANFIYLIQSNPDIDSEVGNTLSWDFTNLAPLESREINIWMHFSGPNEFVPPINEGSIFPFTSTINTVTNDETPNNNTFELNQTVVNSYDPNDKTCLEGNTITSEQVGDYLHYMIRFENIGTAEAVNIVVKDDIDTSKYDLASLIPLHASHNYIARIKNNASDHYVEFIFENINLPFDDANNDGYIVFKIKTLDTLVLGDTFENDAEIYFDFNSPIITNNEQTTVAILSTEDFELANNDITLYPNPTTNILHLEAKQSIKQISIYEISGRQIQDIAVIGSKTEMTISTEALSTGTYFVKIKTETNEIVKKFIKD